MGHNVLMIINKMVHYTLLCLFAFCFNVINCNNNLGVLSNTTDCSEILNEFSVALSDFTNCSVHSAQPITVCENCAFSYNNIINSYSELKKTTNNGIKCINNYVNLDRLQVVNSAFKYSIDLWNRAKCDDCVKFINGSFEPTEIKKEFNTKYDIFYKCTLIYNSTNTTDLCTNCIDEYINLNKFYINKGDITHGIDGVCMDIVDLMNKTQSQWSKTCFHYREKNETIYIITTVFMGLLPILFYVLVKLFVDIKRPTLSPQNRFAESMNTPSASLS